ncbi:enoyl-CoA hydratase-related protein [Calidifontibacillus erzurumensis]|uniref:Enoyl-CoA hydratase domain-containing protein 3, mitochondrial n=1 Tax=Calidifontibacillus erzurumensis TaxID=2741433 RepID=A0A8J8KEB3_9BACI|nr:enoyl-CoA hydratase-related protein [Calidifontibacillus erzurumensis]NSL51640.1 enoyl-CoA hydratase/isomerase family protein [Calidifontibacillus erzurumensis]
MSLILYEENGKIGTVTLNNDKERNALSLKLIRELDGLLKRIAEERKVNVIIIQALGKVFSSGHNLREIDGAPEEEVQQIFNECQVLMKTIREIPQVVIAKVHDIATAAGAQLVAAADLAIASEQAKFATPGPFIGLFCHTPAVFVSRNLDRKKAAELLFTGDFISAEEAKIHGLINRVVPHEKLDEETLKFANSVARHSLYVLEAGKKQLYRQLEINNDFEALSYSTEIMVKNSQKPDAVEGIRAFLEKRQPVWSDR